MAHAVTPSTKPISREQAGKFSDRLIPRLRRSNIKSASFQMVLKDAKRSGAMLDAIVTVVREHTDKIGEIIRIDRKIRPVYPDWAKKPMHPELEATGPAEYNLCDVGQWLHEKQKTGVVGGKDVYKHLKSTDDLKDHLDLRDLQAIQKLGIVVFRKHFAGKAVFGWKSVVLNRNGSLDVPCLLEGGGEVELYWFWFDSDFDVRNPALRFRK